MDVRLKGSDVKHVRQTMIDRVIECITHSLQMETTSIQRGKEIKQQGAGKPRDQGCHILYYGLYGRRRSISSPQKEIAKPITRYGGDMDDMKKELTTHLVTNRTKQLIMLHPGPSIQVSNSCADQDFDIVW